MPAPTLDAQVEECQSQAQSKCQHTFSACKHPTRSLVEEESGCREHLETPQGRTGRDKLDHCPSIHTERMRRMGMSRYCAWAWAWAWVWVWAWVWAWACVGVGVRAGSPEMGICHGSTRIWVGPRPPRRSGLCGKAARGTLFPDEVSLSLPPSLIEGVRCRL